MAFRRMPRLARMPSRERTQAVVWSQGSKPTTASGPSFEEPAANFYKVERDTLKLSENVAQAFMGQVDLTGVVLTRMDGDARGGAALSMRHVTGKPIKFAGTGEKLDALEVFQPARVASRILGMGDIVSIVEKAAQAIEQEEAERMAERMAKGQFDMNDLRTQLRQMQNMGGLGALAGMMPGMKKAKAAMQQSGMDDKVLLRMDAIIGSMTPKERGKPGLVVQRREIDVALQVRRLAAKVLEDALHLLALRRDVRRQESAQAQRISLRSRERRPLVPGRILQERGAVGKRGRQGSRRGGAVVGHLAIPPLTAPCGRCSAARSSRGPS